MGNSQCLLQTLEDVTLQSHSIVSDDSILLKASLRNCKQKYSSEHDEKIDVFLKLAPSSSETDNSLDNERELYMYISHEVLKWTPHVARALVTGHCDDHIILGQTTQLSNLIRTPWVNLRMSRIEEACNERELAKIKSIRSKYSQQDADHRILLHEFKNKFRFIEYVVVEQMNGINLSQFTPSNPEDFDFPIAQQMAQVLYVFHKCKIQHNCLNNLENIMIEEKDSAFEYEIPHKAVFRSRYSIKIYDFSKSTGDDFQNKALDAKWCAQDGYCNRYRRNFDWYCFMRSFVKFIQAKRATPLQYLFQIDYNSSSCKDISDSQLQKIMNPKAFLKLVPMLNF